MFQCQDSHLRERKHTQTPTNPKTPLSFSFSLSQQTNTHKKKKKLPTEHSFETDYKQGPRSGFQKRSEFKTIEISNWDEEEGGVGGIRRPRLVIIFLFVFFIQFCFLLPFFFLFMDHVFEYYNVILPIEIISCLT